MWPAVELPAVRMELEHLARRRRARVDLGPVEAARDERLVAAAGSTSSSRAASCEVGPGELMSATIVGEPISVKPPRGSRVEAVARGAGLVGAGRRRAGAAAARSGRRPCPAWSLTRRARSPSRRRSTKRTSPGASAAQRRRPERQVGVGVVEGAGGAAGRAAAGLGQRLHAVERLRALRPSRSSRTSCAAGGCGRWRRGPCSARAGGRGR